MNDERKLTPWEEKMLEEDPMKLIRILRRIVEAQEEAEARPPSKAPPKARHPRAR